MTKASFGQSSLGGLPFVRTFTTLDYNAGIQNWDIAQDKRGILYIANNFGLLEFDGSTWETYRVTNGTKVRSVAIDGHGRIYVGCQGDFGYFFPDNRGKLVYTSLADSLPPANRNFDETWSVYVDNQRVYFCTFSTIYVYNGKSFAIAQAETDLELSFFVNRKLFVTSRSQGIDLVDDTKFVPFSGGAHFSNKSISSILALHQDELLISTFQHGIFRLHQGVVSPWAINNFSFFKESNVNCMTRLRNGNIAVGTQNNGLLILNAEGSVITRLTTGHGLENRTILSLYEDELNNLWIGQNNGIAYVELGSPFTFINEQGGVPGTGYAAYLDDNTLYVGTNTGVYIKDKNPGSRYQLLENTGGQVYHIGKYGTEILIGHHNGTLAVRDNRAVSICAEPGSWTFLHPTDHPSYLIGGSYTGLHLYESNGGRWQYTRKYSGFHESSRIMSRQNAGSIWMTHGYKGAFKIQFSPTLDSIQQFALYGINNGFPSNNLLNVFRVKSELIFTSERGMFQYDPHSDRFLKDKLFTKHLGDNVQLWAIQQDALENIYFIGSEHIGVLRKNALGDYSLETNTFNKIRKYLNDDLVNISVLKNNEVLFGAKDGFIHYNPS
ncbi:MAG TPA: two component regulator three y domain-containing protein, partial [Chryseosolibacter sp.]|nr:two component regulator three y domain-containing protein [Chryseosolibacter sp.]